jgi:hypothetical protein
VITVIGPDLGPKNPKVATGAMLSSASAAALGAAWKTVPSASLSESAVVKVAIPPMLSVAVGPKRIPAGFIRNRLALPKPLV